MSGSTFSVLAVNGTTLPGLKGTSFDERERDNYGADDGQMHLTTATVVRTAPLGQFTTHAVRQLFAILGTGDEVPFAVLDGVNGFDMRGVQVGTAPGPAGGSVHARRQFLNGLLMLDRLSWRSSDYLEASASAYAKSSAGGTDPIARTTAAAPTVPINTERLGLSSLTLGGLSIPKLLSVDIEIQHQVENNDEGSGCYDAGLPYPILLKQPGAGGASQVKATFDTLDLTTSFSNGAMVGNWAVANHLGVGLGGTGILATINGGMVRSRSISANGLAARRLEIIGTFDGSNRPITIATY